MITDPDMMHPPKSTVDASSEISEKKSENVDVLEKSIAGPGSDVGEDDVTVEEERRLLRKLDRRIMPLICLMYLGDFLDRTNLGNARLQGLPQDALGGDPTGVLFDWVNSAFFFSYISFQLPATLVSKLVTSRIWLGMAAVGWGICSTLTATGFNFAGLMIARLGIGVFEACFAPGIPLYLTYFYTKHDMGERFAYFQSFGAVAGAFGGLIAFGIQNAKVPFSNWRLLFVVEGIPSVLIGVIAIFLLPNRPEISPFFNERERKVAIFRMNRGLSSDGGLVVKRDHIHMAFKDWRIYMGGVIYFAVNNAYAALSAFLPTIIQTFGVSDAIAQVLTVPPNAVAGIVLIAIAKYSDKKQTRGLPLVAMSLLGAIGYLLLLFVPTNVHVRYFAVFCVASSVYTIIGLVIAWYAHNLGSETKKATGYPMFMAIGQCGSILGSHIYPLTEGPRYIRGFAVSCGLMFISAIAALILTISYYRDNKERDRLYGVPKRDARVDTSTLADKAPDFRYVV